MINFIAAHQQLQYCLSLILLFISVFLFLKNRIAPSIFFLYCSSITLYLLAGLMDPFLWPWDERFHALVAKNMIVQPFVPMLIADPILKVGMDYTGSWVGMHIWLHKQPLFLWQMAISMKLFGVNEFALRLPSILMASLIPLMVYGIGKRSVGKEVGYIAAVFSIYSAYTFQLVSGMEAMEHNDLAFTFYCTGAIWSWIEYRFSNSLKWVILCGLFTGGAVLNKWLTAGVIFGAWGFDILLSSKRREMKPWMSLLVAVLVCSAVFLPWQIYILNKFPKEAKMEYRFNQLHITEALEGHEGTFLYHLEKIDYTYGTGALLLLIPGFIVLFYRCRDKFLAAAIFFIPFVVYLFFGIVKTKVRSHVYFVSSIFFITYASLVFEFTRFIFSKLQNRTFYSLFFLTIISYISIAKFDWTTLRSLHSVKTSEYREMIAVNMKNRQMYFQIAQRLPIGTVVFNFPEFRHIEMMFYGNLTAYGCIPSQEQINQIRSEGRSIAVVELPSVLLPDYILRDSSIVHFKADLN